jgi:hypothetical protein
MLTPTLPQYPVLTAHEPLRAHWQISPSGSESPYQTPSESRTNLDPSALDRRKRKQQRGEPPVIHVKTKTKQKHKASDHQSPSGKDPLDIAYGSIIGTTSEITGDDFQVDEDIRTQVGPLGPEHSTERDISPQGRDPEFEESRRWEESNHNIDTPFRRPPEGPEDDQNVWDSDEHSQH